MKDVERRKRRRRRRFRWLWKYERGSKTVLETMAG